MVLVYDLLEQENTCARDSFLIKLQASATKRWIINHWYIRKADFITVKTVLQVG